MERFLKHILKIILFLILTQSVQAQYSETIVSSRPGVSFTPYTTGGKVFQIQTGFIYNGDKDDNYESSAFNYVLLGRYGITENFEIRSTMILRSESTTSSGIENSTGGLNLWDIGMRWNIINGKGTGAALGIQAEFRINNVGPLEYKTDNLTSQTILLFSIPINSWLGFTTNLGASWYQDTGSPAGIYTLNFAFPFSNKIGGFIEMFGTFSNGELGTSFDTGIGYLVTKNLQLDLSFGIVDRIQTNFIDLGLSWRLVPKNIQGDK